MPCPECTLPLVRLHYPMIGDLPMADTKAEPVAPLTDIEFMSRARDVLERLTPMQRGLALWFLVTDEDSDRLGATIEATTELIELANALKDPADLSPSVRWLRSKLDVARVNVGDRDSVKGRRRT